MQFELTWRDYYKFFTMKHGNGIFLEYGTKGRDVEWRNNPQVGHPVSVFSQPLPLAKWCHRCAVLYTYATAVSG